jgi:hypothetical protein
VCKLEKEHKRLQADAAVYNQLQEELNLSPAYKMVQPSSFPVLDVKVMKKDLNSHQKIIKYTEKHTHWLLIFRSERKKKNEFC